MQLLDDSGIDSEDRLSTVFEDVNATVDEPVVGFRGTSTTDNYEQLPNTCRILQRKLELKVEKAKRTFNQNQQQVESKTLQSDILIPISLLAIPGDNAPLVDYKSDGHESDEPEEISFFPSKAKHQHKHKQQQLSDTFSIQEMILDSDLESNDSQDDNGNLDLLAPNFKTNIFDKFKSCFSCFSAH